MFRCLCLIFVIEAEQLDYGSNQSDPIYAHTSPVWGCPRFLSSFCLKVPFKASDENGNGLLQHTTTTVTIDIQTRDLRSSGSCISTDRICLPLQRLLVGDVFEIWQYDSDDSLGMCALLFCFQITVPAKRILVTLPKIFHTKLSLFVFCHSLPHMRLHGCFFLTL